MHSRIAVLIAILSLASAAAWFIFEAGADSVRADMAEAIKQAVKDTREKERKKQEKVNAIAQKQYDEQTNINTQLSADLVRLRNRPSRRHVPNTSRAACTGATGADLSSRDAEFLVREAARADTLRTALKACYDYADSVVKR